MLSPSDNLIITAASESYSAQIKAFLGSLRCNWPNHPPVRVYDLGFGDETREAIIKAGFEVRAVPPFVAHWRKHYTWKIWCMNDASAKRVLWLDAGCCILRPLPEIFQIIESQGYFGLPNHEPLDVEASDAACEGCGVSFDLRKDKSTVTGAVFGFSAKSSAMKCVQEALEVAKTERFIMATEAGHRHDQAILSLLVYRDIKPLILCDSVTYFFEDMRAKFSSTHGIWAARRSMHYKDRRIFASCLTGDAKPHLPRASHKLTLWYRLAWSSYAFLRRLTGQENVVPNGVK